MDYICRGRQEGGDEVDEELKTGYSNYLDKSLGTVLLVCDIH